jgi:uracil-DNA glycosylase
VSAAQETGAEPWVPEGAPWDDLRNASSACRGCDLWHDATQVVFGEGPVPCQLMLVGEQPGDKEDLQGRPFVGPAGRILTESLSAAGLAREDVYLTNAVKHFRHEQRGKKRIHRKPSLRQLTACAPWMHQEILTVGPKTVVALGATAARALTGRPVRIGDVRGSAVDAPLPMPVFVTAHPSSILRLRDPDERTAATSALVEDLRKAVRFAAP